MSPSRRCRAWTASRTSNGLVDFVSEARSYGINSVVIFPKVRTQLRGAACLLQGTSGLVARLIQT